jgi:hypothetical protein
MAAGGPLFRLDEGPIAGRMGNFNGSIDGVEKAQTGHRPAGKSGLESLSGVFTVEHTRIAQEMDVDKGEQDDQAEAAAEPLSQAVGHWLVLFCHSGSSSSTSSLARRKGCLQDESKFTFCRRRSMWTDFSRFKALVRKRESLLKFIYERRKGEGYFFPGRKSGPRSWPSSRF